MKITTKKVRSVVEELEWIVKVYKKENPEPKRDWRTYEQRVAYRIKLAMNSFEPLIEKAVSTLEIDEEKHAGRKTILSLKQKIILLLIKHLFRKSNREMTSMLTLFSLLNDVDVSYKTIERLYTDEKVLLVLHNLHELLLKEKGITETDSTGDGTGYTLTIKKHYASEAGKLKDKVKNKNLAEKELKTKKLFIYSFNLMDFKTRLYIGFGTSFKSEKKAYENAIEMVQNTGIKVKSIRLDRYYSAQKNVKELGEKFKNTTIYLIPKKNATIKGHQTWKKTLARFTENVTNYLKQYFHRNQSESGFSEDKKRFGWNIAQRKPNTIHTAQFCTIIWHNLFWIG
jgi:transposase